MNNPDPNLSIYVIWEPVLLTDWHQPGGQVLARVADRRVIQYWDQDHQLSKAFGGPDDFAKLAPAAQVGFRMRNVIWDSAALYSPGIFWTNGLPKPIYFGAPVVDQTGQIASRLTR